jgi:hypothetical protein
VDYINIVIDPTLSLLSGELMNEVLPKKLAFHRGPVAVDSLIDLLDGRAPSDISTPLACSVERLIRVCNLPVDEETATAWLRANAIITMMEHQAAGESAASLSTALAASWDLRFSYPSRSGIAAVAHVGDGDRDDAPPLLEASSRVRAASEAGSKPRRPRYVAAG